MGNEEETSSVEDWFGRRVREERELRGWTQFELAERLQQQGISLHPSAIAKIELRDVDRPRAIRLDEAKALSEAFGVDLAQMLLDSPSARVHQLAKRIRHWVDSSAEEFEYAEELAVEVRELLTEVERASGPAERKRIEFKLCAHDFFKLVNSGTPALVRLSSKLRHPGRRIGFSVPSSSNEVELSVDDSPEA
ncbi:helix-turn-helix transcriptional regulator [Rhodococcus sp. IEGM 1379]|uniref:helix-turn-helix domain-containing protein n=1 Tax=Rhodococcus sp. IEGM 1379 TaxID=3047086 RepID=UPI0024B85414|nr:helix-turn-helix transcriptional regulator [Rhodococcus sp. IEGM 1379]MDI9917853.1 helix-turn-helix transcriptional regulator [Rhodococcus sp. IEGM 1379]